MDFSRRSAAVAMLFAFTGALSACDGFKKVKDACSVTIVPRDFTVPVNATVPVVGTAFDCDGNSIPNKTIRYSSSNSAVASVTTTGQVVGLTVGTAVVSAVANGKSGEANVTVTPERVQTVTTAPPSATLRRGQTLQLTAVAKNAQAVVIPGIVFQWQSSNSSIGSVDNTGKLTALAPGVVNITATSDGQTGSSIITITEVLIGSCELTPGNQKVTVSNQAAPTLTLKDTAGNALSTTGRAITWASDNNLIATVNPSGVVNAVKAGTAKITASDQTNPAVSCFASVEVVNARIVTANITPVNAQLRVGVPRQYTVALLDSNNAPLSPVGRIITWKNPTPTVATVSATGIVVGSTVSTSGKVAIDAEGALDTASFTVTLVPVVSITLSPLQKTVVEGLTTTFIPTVKDSANNTVTDRTLEWLSSDNSRATVSPAGLVTTLAPGNVTITANHLGVTGSAALIITAVPVDTIEVVSTTFTLQKNTQSQFSINLKSAAGAQLRNRSVIVTSDQPSVATGVANSQAIAVTVTGVTSGAAVLTIQAVNSLGQNEGKPSKITVTVTP